MMRYVMTFIGGVIAGALLMGNDHETHFKSEGEITVIPQDSGAGGDYYHYNVPAGGGGRGDAIYKTGSAGGDRP